MNICVNGKLAAFNHKDLPMLVSGKDKSGASFYTIALAASFYKAWKKMIFFCAYPMGVEELMNQINNSDDIEYVTKQSKPLNKRLIIIKPGDQQLFSWVLGQLDDLDKRFIIIKNIENHSLALSKVLFKKNIILSGNIDACPEASILREKEFSTTIYFSRPGDVNNDWQEPEKYHGIIYHKKLSSETWLA